MPRSSAKWATHLSGTKIADGLDILDERSLIVREPEGRSTFQLTEYDRGQGGWCMIPAKALYSKSNGIRAFADFHLRRRAELDGLKAYLAFAARRDRKDNRAHMTYEQIEDYTGISGGNIKAATSLLVINNLVVVDQRESSAHDRGMSFSYRLTHLEPRKHQGTLERGVVAV